jgi:hypothetical protein
VGPGRRPARRFPLQHPRAREGDPVPALGRVLCPRGRARRRPRARRRHGAHPHGGLARRRRGPRPRARGDPIRENPGDAVTARRRRTTSPLPRAATGPPTRWPAGLLRGRGSSSASGRSVSGRGVAAPDRATRRG